MSSSRLMLRSNRRPRGGRMFVPTHERRLEPAARQVLHSLPGSTENLLAIREVSGPYGVPDIVGVFCEPDRMSERRQAEVAPLLNEIDAGIVAVANASRAISPSVIAARLGWSERTVVRRLEVLERGGAIELTRNGNVLRHPGLRPLGPMYAVEMKVDNWRRAITQCRTYRLWTDSYVLVLGGVSRASEQELIDEVRRDGGGLVVGGEVVLKPRLGELVSARRLWGSEHVYAATLRKAT